MENDLIVWFDSKTGEEMENQDKFIDEVREIANKYGFDFYMSGSPGGVKKLLLDIERLGKE